MEIIPNYGRQQNIVNVKEDPDLIIVSDNLPHSSSSIPPTAVLADSSEGGGVNYNSSTSSSNCNELGRVPSVTFSPVTLPPHPLLSTPFNNSLQIPEEIQVEPIVEYYQNGVEVDYSSNNGRYPARPLSYTSGGVVVETTKNEFGNNRSQQQQLASNYNDGYHYQEPEENFISIDDIKAKPFLFNVLNKPSAVDIVKRNENRNTSNHSNITKSARAKEQSDVDLVVIDDDDDDDGKVEDDENSNHKNSENKKEINKQGTAVEEESDVILIEDDDDEMVDENEVGEELDWMAFEQEQKQEQERRQEQEQEESDKQTYECFLCNKKVASNYNLRRHMMIHTGERPFGCDICFKRFREFSDLKKHRRVHCNEEEYKCMVCKVNAPSPTNPTKCKECDVEDRHSRVASSSSTSNYGDMFVGEAPCIEGSDKKAYVCPICDRIFGSRHNLKRHFMIHTGEKPYKCDVCNKSFREVSTLKKHMLTHSRIKLFKCAQCGREYSDFSTYTRHKNIAHPNQIGFSLIDAFTPSSSAMKDDNHLVIASVTSGNGAYSALKSSTIKPAITNKSLSLPSSLHNKDNDQDNYLFQCGDCYKKFTNASIYKEHLKLHSRDFTFQCYICKKMFRTKEKLNSHFITHEYDDNNDNGDCNRMLINDQKLQQILQEH